VCSQAAEVGGDFFDVFDLPDGSRLVMIADVMGKGVPAALVATTLRTALRSLATTTAGPGELLTRVNRQLFADLDRLGMFITVQILRLDATGAEIRHASAGHCPPLVFCANDAARWWDETGGLPVGIDARETYEEGRGVLAPGERLWLMTDGALEQEDACGAELGGEGLAALAARATDASALLAALNTRAEGRPPRDDCTLVLIAPRATPPIP
jgi:sigma-B regulation protein RsbU (phosphoserine phosphatase)